MTQLALCNRALLAIGEAGNLTSLAPPSSPLAEACATLYQPALELVTVSRAWTFCQKRATLAKPRVAIASFTAITNIVTTSLAHGVETNDQVTLQQAIEGSGTAPTGLTIGDTYYGINLGSTSLTLTDEEDGDAIDFTTAGTGAFVLERETDRAGRYMFALPSDCLVERFVVPTGAPDTAHSFGGYSLPSSQVLSWGGRNYPYCGSHGEQRLIEVKRARNKAGEVVVYSELEECDLLYTAALTEVTDMPPEFQEAVVMMLASKLSLHRSPELSQRLRGEAQAWISEAARIDAQRDLTAQSRSYPWDRG